MYYFDGPILLVVAIILALHIGMALMGTLKINNILEELIGMKKVGWILFVWLVPVVGLLCLNKKFKLTMPVHSSTSGSDGYADGGC